MKIRTLIEAVDNRYDVQVSTFDFTTTELQLIRQFGEPLVEVGGSFSGTVSRPGQINTTAAASGGGGTGAVLSVVVSAAGVVTSILVVSPGSGYGSAPDVAVTGDGTGALATATVSGGLVTGVTLSAGGSGYHVVPVAVIFTKPLRQVRLMSDFPSKMTFDLDDTADADVEAKVWSDTIISRLTIAKQTLIDQTSPLEGETVITV